MTSAADLLLDRKDWLQVTTLERANGGWDVVLVLDGTYHGEATVSREAMVELFAERLAAALRSADADAEGPRWLA